MHSGCLWLSKEIKLLLARCVGNASRSSFINLPGRFINLETLSKWETTFGSQPLVL